MSALCGMTGFARVEGEAEGVALAIAARSVNGRSLKVRLRAPPGFEALDRAARELAQSRFARGQVSAGLTATREAGSEGVRIDTPRLDAYLAAARPDLMAGKAEKPRFDGLLALPGVIQTEDAAPSAEARARLEDAATALLAQAFDRLREARRAEGAALASLLAALPAERAGVGRRLDFLCQEFMREANTLCAKSASTALTGLGLKLKAVIEQFREQVQNVE